MSFLSPEDLVILRRAAEIECDATGHHWVPILVEGSWDPHSITCSRCGRTLKVADPT